MRLLPLLIMPFLIASARAQPAGALVLPTENDAIFRGEGPRFYMFTNRTFEGRRSTPWQAGQYGFVRNPVRTRAGIFYTRFHEGVDIAPVARDGSGSPVDTVKSVADGKVVYVNDRAGASNYGKYIVIEHRWGGSPYYSLYAHLRSTSVNEGAGAAKGQTIGRMGWTGSGLDKRRSHLHFEINLLINSKFQGWHDKYFGGSPNHHGIYNGLNLTGIDVAGFYLARRKNPEITIPEFVRSTEAVYKVRLPAGGRLELVRRYPWLAGEHTGSNPASWIIGFTGSGLPVSAEPSSKKVRLPEIVWTARSAAPVSYRTRGYIGSGKLTSRGKRYMHLLIWP